MVCAQRCSTVPFHKFTHPIHSQTHFSAYWLQMELLPMSCCCTTQLLLAVPMAALLCPGLLETVPLMTCLGQESQESVHCHQLAMWLSQDCGCTGLMATPSCQEVGVVTEIGCFMFSFLFPSLQMEMNVSRGFPLVLGLQMEPVPTP